MNKIQQIIKKFQEDNVELSQSVINSKILFFLKNNEEVISYIEEYFKDFSINLTFKEKILYAKFDIKEPLVCEECGSSIKITKRPKKYCSTKCVNKNKSKIAKSWWTDLSDSEKIKYKELYKEKFRQSNISKYGIDTPYSSQIPEVVEKRKLNYKQRTGFEHWMNNPEVKEKLKNTMIKKYGVEHSFQNPKSLEKFKQTMLERYGVESPYHSPDIFKKMIKNSQNTKYYKWDDKKILYQGYTNKLLDDLKLHNEVFENIKTEWNCPIFQYTIEDKLHLYRPDLYLEREKIIFEVKSIYTLFYDLENNFHKFIATVSDGFTLNLTLYNKNEKYMFVFLPYINFNDYNIIKEKFIDYNIMFFWQNDLYEKTDLIISMIKNKLYYNVDKKYARKLVIDYNPNIKEVKEFLNNNHLQGYSKYNYAIALKEKDIIYSIMTFSKGRVMYKNNSDWEINRFAILKNHNIPGAASKLLKNFMNKYNIKRIISYSDILISEGNLYKKLGFIKQKNVYKGYFYFKDDMIFNRFKFTKSNLIKMGFDKDKTEKQIMEDLGYTRIETPGNYKFILEK